MIENDTFWKSESLKRGRYGARLIHHKNMTQKLVEAFGIWFTWINHLVHDLRDCSICTLNMISSCTPQCVFIVHLCAKEVMYCFRNGFVQLAGYYWYFYEYSLRVIHVCTTIYRGYVGVFNIFNRLCNSVFTSKHVVIWNKMILSIQLKLCKLTLLSTSTWICGRTC